MSRILNDWNSEFMGNIVNPHTFVDTMSEDNVVSLAEEFGIAPDDVWRMKCTILGMILSHSNEVNEKYQECDMSYGAAMVLYQRLTLSVSDIDKDDLKWMLREIEEFLEDSYFNTECTLERNYLKDILFSLALFKYDGSCTREKYDYEDILHTLARSRITTIPLENTTEFIAANRSEIDLYTFSMPEISPYTDYSYFYESIVEEEWHRYR